MKKIFGIPAWIFRQIIWFLSFKVKDPFLAWWHNYPMPTQEELDALDTRDPEIKRKNIEAMKEIIQSPSFIARQNKRERVRNATDFVINIFSWSSILALLIWRLL